MEIYRNSGLLLPRPLQKESFVFLFSFLVFLSVLVLRRRSFSLVFIYFSWCYGMFYRVSLDHLFD